MYFVETSKEYSGKTLFKKTNVKLKILESQNLLKFVACYFCHKFLRWVAFVTADILPPPQKFLLLPQVPIIMVVSPSQIVFAWVARLCRFGPKREITPRNTHFRAYFKD